VRAVVLAAERQGLLRRRRPELDAPHGRLHARREPADAGQLADMLWAIYECPKPTVAAVQGDVFAGGMGLVAACDMAGERATPPPTACPR
jgi:methylglutaconyl-CoA hydratase